MKPTSKSFTVEVKRSRSGSSFAKPAAGEQVELVDPQLTLPPLSVSKARQRAEEVFASLTSVEPRGGSDAALTAESVFRSPAPRSPTVYELPAEPAQAEKVETPVSPKARRGRPRKIKSPEPVAAEKKPAKPKTPKKAKSSAPAAAALRDIPAITVPPPSVRVSQASPQPVSSETASPHRQARDWAPGERWKKRLRHLR